jgi:hypothetical protein
MLGRERRKHDPVQSLYASEFSVEWQRPSIEPYR